MAQQTILAIDQGTTGTKTLLMDNNAKVIADYSEEFQQHFPKPGWVEHDPDQIWTTVLNGIKAVTKGIDPKSIAGIGITNQRETVCFWSKKTKKKLANAIVWQDRRTAEFCETLKSESLEPRVQESTGLLLDPYFSGTKISWAIQNWESVRKAAESNDLAIGTIDSYLIHRLTDGQSHVTEPSNASRTLCYNIHKLEWDEEICDRLSIPLSCLPKVLSSSGEFGKTKNIEGLPDGISISGCLGDQQAALMGQTCFEAGSAKCTYGTGAFLLLNTGNKPKPSHHRLLTTIAWNINNQTTYALEGSAFIAGAAVQWLRDGLGLFSSSSEIEALARSVDSSEGVSFVPALTGLGAPYWDSNATGMITGITRGTTKAHIARAALEGIALQITDLLQAMQKDLGEPLKSLNVDGGASANDLLMQFQSDVLNVSLNRPKYVGTTSMGAVFAAGLGCGVWNSLDDLKSSWSKDKTFEPKMQETKRVEVLDHWMRAINRVRL